MMLVISGNGEASGEVAAMSSVSTSPTQVCFYF